MNLTEILVTGYDGDKFVMAADLTADGAKTILTTHDDGDTAVEASAEHAGPAFSSLVQTLKELANASA